MDMPFTDGFNRATSLAVMNRACTNFYPKYISAGEQNGQPIYTKHLFGTPGQSQLATTGTAASNRNRGAIVMNGIPYFVNGTTLYRLNSALTTTSLGTVAGNSLVSMAQNGTQVMVLARGNGYIYNANTSTFSAITDPDFLSNGTPLYVIYIDGYFMAVTDEKKVIISNLNDGTAWAALDFGSAESDPDATVALVSFRNQAYVLGTETIEGLDNVGGADFPFLRNGVFLDKGLLATFSVIEAPGAFMFIGGGDNEDAAVWMFDGSQLRKISNTGVDLLLAALNENDLNAVSSFSYSQDGDTFVGWGLRNDTIVYGIQTGKWHLRMSRVTNGAGYVEERPWRSMSILKAYNKIICFDNQDGRVGELSRSFYDEYGTEILRFFDVSPIRVEKRAFCVPRFEVTIQAGVGDNTTPDPQIRMKKSKDGQSFSAERNRSMGNLGQYEKRCVWRGNGRFAQYALFRVLTSEKVQAAIVRVDAEIVPGLV